MSRPWLAVACETCHAGENAPCHVDGLGPVAFAHPARMAAWATLTIQRVAGTMAEACRGKWRDMPAPCSSCHRPTTRPDPRGRCMGCAHEAAEEAEIRS